MHKRALAPLAEKIKEEPEQVYQPENWVQEEEVLKLRLQNNRLLERLENPRERLQQLLPGFEMKKLVL